MIVDQLENYRQWKGLHPGFEPAFSFLLDSYQNDAIEGKHVLIPDRLWVIIERGQGRTEAGAKLEAHRRFIDIQLVLRGNERIGWLPLGDCCQPSEPYNAERDIEFFADRPSTWIDLAPGQLAIFYPTDAHAPLAGQGEVIKAIAKVALGW